MGLGARENLLSPTIKCTWSINNARLHLVHFLNGGVSNITLELIKSSTVRYLPS